MWKIYRSCRAGRILFCQTSTRPLTKCGKVGQTQEKVVKEKSCEELVIESCLILCNNIDCSLPGTTVHRISEARMLELVAFPFCRGTSQPRDRTWVSFIAGRFFTLWATREAPFLKVARWFLDHVLSFFFCPFQPCRHRWFEFYKHTNWRHSWLTVSGFVHTKGKILGV